MVHISDLVCLLNVHAVIFPEYDDRSNHDGSWQLECSLVQIETVPSTSMINESANDHYLIDLS